VKVLDLFSGIGGFSLGLERAGFTTVAFCEIEPFCRAVLKKHWPHVPCYEDVRTLTAERLAADGISVDVICGGFPCQDISFAGKGAGIEGERSGLWSEYARLIGELRPRYVIVENVAALLGRGLDVVLGDLASIGFDAEWHCIPASAVGAPHRRDRLWLVAHASGTGLKARYSDGLGDAIREAGQAALGCCANDDVADTDRPERWPHIASRGSIQRPDGISQGQEGSGGFGAGSEAVANANHPRLEIALDGDAGQFETAVGSSGQWAIEPDVGRVAHGVPSRVDRLRALGNAVVPQIPEIIGRAILASEAA
jgi:DNA (cytosine-5)-methyltransferase 1